MAQFPKIQLTQLGKNIILAGQNKQKVTFTKVELGDGLLDGQSVDDMTALVHSVMSLPLQNFLNNGDGSARLRFVLDNNNLAKGFFNREIGVFAKIDDGEEQLYAYTNAGNLADYIPGKESPISSKIINLHIIVGNAMNLTIVAENSAYVTKLDMDSHKAAVEIDHPDASVTTPKIRDGAVTSVKIAERAIEKKHLRKGGIVAGDIGAYSKEDVDKLLADHRTKTPLDHPDGSVLKKHLGFTVYDKSETDARLNTKANANHGYHVPSPEAANNTRFLRNDNTWQTVTAGNIGAYTKGETYTKGEIDSRVNGKVSKSGDTMSGRLTLPSILANDWFRALGDCGFYFEDHGGGWHMTDNDWIRAYNGKNIYTSGEMRCDGGFEGNLRGTANNANVAQHVNNESQNMRFHWSGQSGQPTWLWGGNDPHNMYVWNPANFNVNHAKTADNATRATNADKLQGKDVNHFYRRLGGRETPTLVPLVDWERMKKENGGQDVRNIRNLATGIVAYGGGTTFGGKYANGTIFLKQSYRNFDKVLVFIVDITGRDTTLNLLDSWLLFFLFANSFTLDLIQDATLIWNVYGNKRGSSSEALSTETLWRGFYQNCGLIEIYGMNY